MFKATGDAALQHAISAAELYMKAARETTVQADKMRFKQKCKELIAHAERLKQPPPPPPDLTPKQSRELPTAEKTILLRSSKLHGAIFPPWEVEPADHVFQAKTGDRALFLSVARCNCAVGQGY
jgi:calpain-7